MKGLNMSQSVLQVGVDKNYSIAQRLFVISVFFLLSLSVVIPNSLQVLTGAALVLSFVLAIPVLHFNSKLIKLGFLYLAGVIVSCIYLVIGKINGAPEIASIQIFFTHVVGPMLWLGVGVGIAQTVGVVKLIRWFGILSFVSCLTVALYFYLFLNFGPDAVTFFKEDGNLDLREGKSAAIMFVYGSLIFLCGGFFSSPGLIKNTIVRGVLLGLLSIAAVTSGRSALMLAIPLGFAVGWLITPLVGRSVVVVTKIEKLRKLFTLVLFVIPLFVAIFYYLEIDVFVILGNFFDELLSGGGSERSDESAALLRGAMDYYGLGAGYGLNVSVIRNFDTPWRYESVLVASLYRVGVIGSIVYLLPFVMYFREVLKLAKQHRLSEEHQFFFSGFVCVFVAANTNPYIESISFQWMYVLPVVLLFSLPQPVLRKDS
jgi:hypothetical protein